MSELAGGACEKGTGKGTEHNQQTHERGSWGRGHLSHSQQGDPLLALGRQTQDPNPAVCV